MINISLHTKLIFLVFGVLIWTSTAEAQRMVPGGIPFQMVAKKQTGDLIVNENLFARVSLLSGTEGNQVVHYSEVHEFTTNAIGQAGFIIGQGMAGPTTIDEVPWFDGNIELEVQISSARLPDFQYYQRTPLRTVPYAFYANQTGGLAGAQSATLRTDRPNTRWLTSGNNMTQPPIHYLGHSDNTDLIFRTNGITRFTVKNSGQLVVDPDDTVTGTRTNKANYPMIVEGGGQGIWIDVNANRTNANNYLTFKDSDKIWGSVHGQTSTEWYDEDEYKYKDAIYTFKFISLAAQIAILTVDGAAAFGASACSAVLGFPFVIFAWAAPGYGIYGGAVIVEGVKVAIESVAWLDASINWNSNKINDLGVQFHSGGADYAEWLPVVNRKEKIAFADIVGVHAGKITKTTKGADHLMVVSESPVILGNHPLDAKEEKYGRPVAFLGQVRVRVVGSVNKGDYILPSGNNDGFGIALSPDSLAASDYAHIVGRAWEDAPNLGVNMVRIAVGIDRNMGAPLLDEIDQGIDQVISYLSGETAQLPPQRSSVSESCEECGSNKAAVGFSNNYLQDLNNLLEMNNPMLQLGNAGQGNVQLLEMNKDFINQAYAKGKRILDDNGIDLSSMPFFEQLFSNPVPILKRSVEDPNYLRQALEATYAYAIEKALDNNKTKTTRK